MAINTNTASNACLVDKFIGTAYDKVAYVADHLDEILTALATSESLHDGLDNLDLPNQHPQSAIIGLVSELAQRATEMSGLLTMLETHESLTNIHFADVPVDDGVEYSRKNRTWVVPTYVVPHNHDALYDSLGSAAAVQAALDAHDHDSQYDAIGAAAAVQTALDAHNHNADYDALGAASAVQSNLDAHNHNSQYLALNMVDSGSTLPDPALYPEGAIFVVTA